MILKAATPYWRKFKMIRSSDHISGATQAIIGALPTVMISKGIGATFAAAAGTVTELDPTNGPGVFQVALTTIDTGITGDLWFVCTGANADPTDFKDEVQGTVFTDLGLDALGNVKIASQVKQNTTFLFPFIMTVNGVATPGLTGFVAQRNLGTGFAGCANAVVEDGVGWYHLLLAPTDTNATVIELHVTASGADALNVTLYTQP